MTIPPPYATTSLSNDIENSSDTSDRKQPWKTDPSVTALGQVMVSSGCGDPVDRKIAEDNDRQAFSANMKQAYQNYRNRPRRVLTQEEKKVRCHRWTGIIIITLIIVIILLCVSLRKVEETEYGVRYATYKKELDDAALSGGLFPGPPGFKMIKFPSTYLTADFDGQTCVSRDGLRVVFDVTFQYQMTADKMLPAIVKYRNVFKWREIVEQGGLSAMHHSCSDFFISDFQNKRGEIQESMLQNLRLKLEGDPDDDKDEGVFALAISVQLRNLKLPTDYNTAVEEKQAAEEDIALAVAQRKQEKTKAETELLKAKEEARKILNTARNEAEVLVTEAYLKANETTFAFEKEAEIIVEVKTALNLNTEGVLTYLANSLYAEVKNLKITAGEPAKLSRLEEL
ncbi:SPFH domain / Band 7 family protein [Nitzschia inconspicua]|uniref:SPFH domain / Band 7 family protein n=1 Tax=Nitzschia inconspicua TaxID=303405 RepID=A0A9K3LZR5_9STRA|nr:SPFH domain / Band 7 family protein [Nitzschia inconspicua]